MHSKYSTQSLACSKHSTLLPTSFFLLFCTQPANTNRVLDSKRVSYLYSFFCRYLILPQL